jgi:2-C-methyl-D-erythritol 4-phosphate cytidylyltransferase
MLSNLISDLADDPVGGILAVPVADTLKRADATQRVAVTEPRDGLWQAQTPQMFRYARLLEALTQCAEVTDEAGAIEALGLKPKLVSSDTTNLKVTYPADLALAAMILRGRK